MFDRVFDSLYTTTTRYAIYILCDFLLSFYVVDGNNN